VALHRSNLIWSWLAGFPGLFPAVSCLTHFEQLWRVRRQEATGQALDFPRGETPRESLRTFIGFVAIIVFLLLALFVWHLIDPEGFAQFASRVNKR
jgi:hypothetical protein